MERYDLVVIGQESEILSAFDPDIAGYVRKILESRRITFHLGAALQAGADQRLLHHRRARPRSNGQNRMTPTRVTVVWRSSRRRAENTRVPC